MTDAIDGLEIHGVPMVEALGRGKSSNGERGKVMAGNYIVEGSSLQNDVVEIKDSATR